MVLKMMNICYLALGTCIFLTGCSSAIQEPETQDQASPNGATEQARGSLNHGHDEHDHDHDVEEPGTLEEAVAELEELASQIVQAWEDDVPESAHDALHEIGHVLEAIPALAAQRAEIQSADRDDITEHVESLFDVFGALDDTLHGGESTPYSDVQPEIQASLEFLRGVIQ